MKSHIKNHFRKVDPILYKIVERIGYLEDIIPCKPQGYFRSLCRHIISQQLARGAANAIHKRFLGLFPTRRPSAKLLDSISEKELRYAGMSWAKARYIKDIAQKLRDRNVRLSSLPKLSDEEVIAELTKIKGVGRWTAEMFLIFSLGRPDVFSFGDLGLRRAMQKLYPARFQNPHGLKCGCPKKRRWIYQMSSFSIEQATPIVSSWSPYRSFASRILWKAL
jgi:DNA-3-methyladenine glycosylase II